MQQRQLKHLPSDTTELSPWQLQVREEVQAIYQEAFQTRRPLVRVIQELALPNGDEAMEEVSFACQMAFACTPAEADARAAEILKPGPSVVEGTRATCVLQWRWDNDSLWRGLSDNKKIARLARSMVSSGFHDDEPIRARSFDLSGPPAAPVLNRLLFGDGQARGLAAKLAWSLVLKRARADPTGIAPGMPCLRRVLGSLMAIPTVFENHGHGSVEDLIIAQAATHNVKATITLPMNTVDWVGVVLRCSGLTLGGGSVNKQNILACLNRCRCKYDEHVEVKAYDLEPVAKRARKGRRKSTAGTAPNTADEGDQDRLKISQRRLTAIRMILESATPESFQVMQMHLVWAGDYLSSAFSDQVFALPWLWPNSIAPEDARPGEAALLARDAGARVSQELIPSKFVSTPMRYEERWPSITANGV